MSVSYTLRESFSGFRRARLSTAFAIFTLWIALVLLGLFLIFSYNTQRLIEAIRARVEMEAFLQQPLDTDDLRRIEQTVLSTPGVDSMHYVSKAEAAKIFERDWGQNVQRVFDMNPLPPSIKVYLKSDYTTAARADELFRRLSSISGVDTVRYRRTLLEIVDARTSVIDRVTLGIGSFITLSAILLVANTIRLTIYAKRHIIQTMELVGATAMFIRWPFLIEGLVQGFIGGLLASGLLYIVVERLTRYLSEEVATFIHMPSWFYAGVVVGGILLGLVGSIVSVSRFLKPNLNR